VFVHISMYRCYLKQFHKNHTLVKFFKKKNYYYEKYLQNYSHLDKIEHKLPRGIPFIPEKLIKLITFLTLFGCNGNDAYNHAEPKINATSIVSRSNKVFSHKSDNTL
jgi:hypothetical protein